MCDDHDTRMCSLSSHTTSGFERPRITEIGAALAARITPPKPSSVDIWLMKHLEERCVPRALCTLFQAQLQPESLLQSGLNHDTCILILLVSGFCGPDA
jgi:hypothetical protein